MLDVRKTVSCPFKPSVCHGTVQVLLKQRLIGCKVGSGGADADATADTGAGRGGARIGYWWIGWVGGRPGG